ncbi:MAG: GPW/gp25 family protein, partial [Sphingomonadales bacterium]
MMRGMSRTDGAALGGDAHLAQSIADVLTTPLGSRVMRRDYGSLLFDLIDQPFSSTTRLLLFSAVPG